MIGCKQDFYLVWSMIVVVFSLGMGRMRVSVDVSVHITIGPNIFIVFIIILLTQIYYLLGKKIMAPGAGPYWNQRWGTSLFFPNF